MASKHTKASLARRVSTIALFRIVASLAVFVGTPIITRLYSPIIYGEWVLWVSTSLLVSAVATLSYELAIVLCKSHRDAANLFFGCVATSLAVALLCGVLIQVLGSSMQLELFAHRYLEWRWSIPLYIFLVGCGEILNAWCVRRERFLAYAVAQATMAVLTPLFQILAASTGQSTPQALIAGSLVGSFCSIVLLTYANWPAGRLQSLLAVEPKRIGELFAEYRVYPLYMAPYNLLSVVQERVIYFFLAKASLPREVGFFGMASRIVRTPSNVLAGALRPVIYQQAVTTSSAALEQTVLRIMHNIIFVMVPLWIVFLLRPGEIFAVVFGEAWREAGVYGAILSCAMVPHTLEAWLDRIFDAAGKQRLAVRLGVAFYVAGIGGVVFGVYVLHSLFAAIVVHTVISALYFTLFLYTVFRVALFSSAGLVSLGMRMAGLCVMWGGIALLALEILGTRVGVVAYLAIAGCAICIRMVRQTRLLDRCTNGAESIHNLP